MSFGHPNYLLILGTIILATSVVDGTHLCRHDQSASLLRLKSSFRFLLATSNLSSWKVNTDCCTWEGITCDSMMGTVTALDLSELGILGNLRSEIFNLTSLSYLNLAGNYFDGTPWSTRGFEQLPHLKYLNFSRTGLSGYIPVENGQLSNLVTLDLSMWSDPKNLSLDTLIDNLGSLQKLYLDSIDILISPINLAHASLTNKTSGIQELSMQYSTITGHIDSALSRLPFLSKLTLDLSVFKSPTPVPESFADFSSLVVLSLRGCGLIGTFPSRILHIRSLEVLDISDNWDLYGELPEFIQDNALEHLIISSTKLSGKIPASMRNLHNLSKVDLSNCQLHGPIPSFAQWPKIQLVDLSNNHLTGSLNLDGDLALQNLTTLRLFGNFISGEIPASLFSYPCLQYLDLSKNNFTGNFLLYPNASLGLKTIYLSENKLQGPIPKLLSKLVGLEQLDLSSNNLIGTVDLSFIKNYKNLTRLLLSDNRLSIIEDGNNPYTEYPILEALRLASCNLTIVPNFLRQQKGIGDLDLSNNHIVGHIPDWIWETREHFVYINLSHNLFTSVKNNLANVSTYHGGLTLDLSSNKIEGPLPITPLVGGQLDYSNNHFNSSVTGEFWSQVLNGWFLSLSNNSLSGEVPHSICNMTYIQVLDLSFNSFSGMIPPCLLEENKISRIPEGFLKKLKAMTVVSALPPNVHDDTIPQYMFTQYYKNLVTVMQKGLELRLVNILSVFTTLDLSNNNFEGTISNEIGDLKSLVGLNLSRNLFSGKIPPQIASILQLESLDLSYNQLSGEIPPAMAHLSFLEVLNLSYNHLSGPIPQSNQFLTFQDTSYLGNDGLCGKPLSHTCDANHTSPAAEMTGSSKEMNWDFLSIEVGVIWGMAIVLELHYCGAMGGPGCTIWICFCCGFCSHGSVIVTTEMNSTNVIVRSSARKIIMHYVVFVQLS
ncbi:hypothetical protein PR202_ga12406 [Eleusine coracana subsp. coracana]|uniref:Leucine-rich repeat-containing N-terminal plant-type domain-containing protein n=1 Tax=Eleusine coracana subsp. coracana TaxID=191504 RepID=A0AAV5CBV8_ELECO|nr:hypothetical protein PR202_ga12406 [Eleusine coracana subsp. coracana]